MEEKTLEKEEIGTCKTCALRVEVHGSGRYVCPVTDVCEDDFFCKAWVGKEEENKE